ncbi:hypothetical protein B0I35DRAFT_410156 [Stachybotrys elegans]|uniref:Uncharacterized protein n=1 Tax=Stachybotrys elegans TaxID=80388 RepID=A0A8K0SN07_9HYPO|nr:hypothetical protein B0I35DRAFT_410156 [Stachybotrys elegans]
MLFRATLGLLAISGLGLAFPLGSSSSDVDPQALEEFNVMLTDWLEKTDPTNITVTLGPGMPTLEEVGYKIEDYFDPDWRVAHGLHEPRRGFTSMAVAEVLARRSDALDSRSEGKLHKRAYCNEGNTIQADLLACWGTHDILRSYDTLNCVARGANTMTGFLVYSYTEGSYTGQCAAWGKPAWPLNYAASYCRDVAAGMQWTFQNCPNEGCRRAQRPIFCKFTGDNTAAGNGNLQLRVDGDRVKG